MTTIKTLLAAAIGAVALSAIAAPAVADSSRKSDVDVYNYGPRTPLAVAMEAPGPRASAVTARFVPQLPTGLVATTRDGGFGPTQGAPYAVRPDSARSGSDR